jgi:hypothetical protein
MAIFRFDSGQQPVVVVSKTMTPASVAEAQRTRKATRKPTTEPTVTKANMPPEPTSTATTRPQWPYIIVSLVLLGAGIAAGILLQRHFHPGMAKLPVIAGFSVFSVLYVMAQAIERLLVPVSWFGGGFLGVSGTGFAPITGVRTKTELTKTHQDALAAALTSHSTPVDKQAAVDTKHDLDQYSANLTATTFGAASLLAMLLSGYTGLFVLNAVGLHVAGWLDVLVTGLAVGGSTKPLHDLISNVSSAGKGKSLPTTL